MILTLDLGATNIKVALFDTTNNPRLIEQRVVPTNADKGFEAIKQALMDAIAPYADSVCAVSIASAGDVDSEKGVITYATDNLPNMTGFDYVGFVKEKFNLPAVAMNDAHAALLGEIRYGVGCVADRVAMLTLGSGVGGGYCVNGKICATEQNDYARFGHICLYEGGRSCNCGKSGCVERYLSGRALHADAASEGLDGDDLFARFALGSPSHTLFVQKFRSNFQLALDKIYSVCPFEVCIVGGGVVDWIGDAFDKVFEGLNAKIVRAELGNYAGVYGALAHICDKGVCV